MASETRRDPLRGHLLTPENAAFIVIDYQPIQVASIRLINGDEMVFKKAAALYVIPTVHPTVNVATGKNKPPIQPIMDVLGSYPRTTEPRSTVERTPSPSRPWSRQAARSCS